MVDAWASSPVAQQFPKQYQSAAHEFTAILRDTKQAGFDLTQNVLSQVSDVVADLKAKQAALEAQQLELAEVVGAMVTFDGDTAYTNTGSIPSGTTYGNLCTVVLDAPAWATRAMVTANGVISATSIGGSSILQGRIVIAGSASNPYEIVAAQSESLDVTPLWFVSLDPAATVTVTLEARCTAGTAGSALARLVATALYLRA